MPTGCALRWKKPTNIPLVRDKQDARLSRIPALILASIRGILNCNEIPEFPIPIGRKTFSARSLRIPWDGQIPRLQTAATIPNGVLSLEKVSTCEIVGSWVVDSLKLHALAAGFCLFGKGTPRCKTCPFEPLSGGEWSRSQNRAAGQVRKSRNGEIPHVGAGKLLAGRGGVGSQSARTRPFPGSGGVAIRKEKFGEKPERSEPTDTLEQVVEPGLNEVMVRGQHLGQSTFLHHHKRDTISQSPFFVRARTVELHGLFKR